MWNIVLLKVYVAAVSSPSSHLVSAWESGFSVISSPSANTTLLRELYLEHARPLVGQMTAGNLDNLYNKRPLLVAYYDIDWSHDGFKGRSPLLLLLFYFLFHVQPQSTGMG